jgi:superfamily II DNA helicase RecQ
MGVRVAAFHAGLSTEDRDEALRNFVHAPVDAPTRIDVVVATVAFGRCGVCVCVSH